MSDRGSHGGQIVYVLTEEAVDDARVLGVYLTLELATAAAEHGWGGPPLGWYFDATDQAWWCPLAGGRPTGGWPRIQAVEVDQPAID